MTLSSSAQLRGPMVTFAPADEGSTGALSIDAAVALLNDEPETDADPAAAAPGGAQGQEPSNATQSEGETSSPEDAAGEAETQTQDGDETQVQEPAAEPLAAPAYWSQEAKAEFELLAQTNPKLAAVVLAQEGPREAATAKAKDEAAKIREAAEKELAGVQQFAEQIKPWLSQAVQTFRSRWGDNPDWGAYAAQHGVEAMTLAKTQWEGERDQLKRVAEAAQTAEVKARQVYVANEFKELERLAPDLVSGEDGGVAKRTEITNYLVKTVGYAPEVVRDISAQDMVIARKAMLWDQAQAKSAPKPAPKPAPSATQPLSRGSAAVGSTDPKAKAAVTAQNRFHKSGSIKDAIAYLNTMDD